jgi:hypothetical protein
VETARATIGAASELTSHADVVSGAAAGSPEVSALET